jgi:hypothetical protein
VFVLTVGLSHSCVVSAQAALAIEARESLLVDLRERVRTGCEPRMQMLQRLLQAENAILDGTDPLRAAARTVPAGLVQRSVVPTKHASGFVVRLAAATLACVEYCSRLLQTYGDVATFNHRVYLEKLQVCAHTVFRVGVRLVLSASNGMSCVPSLIHLVLVNA